MTTARFKAYGIFAIVLSILLFVWICFCDYVLLSVVFFGGTIVPRGTLSPFGAIALTFFFLFLLVALITSWTHYLFAITIDSQANSVFFRNIITQQKTLYLFSDFDGYIDTFAVTGRGGSYKVLYLIKHGKAEKVISGFNYSNVDELREALSPIKYLGFQKNFSRLARRALMNRTLIDL